MVGAVGRGGEATAIMGSRPHNGIWVSVFDLLFRFLDEISRRRSVRCPCDTGFQMDPARKRTIRLTVALSAAVLLAMALIWTSFNASSEAKTPSQLLAAAPTATESYKLTGKVAEGSWVHEGNVHEFRVRDRDGTESVPVRYKGSVPGPLPRGP